MIIVSNTSPLTNLAAIGKFSLLKDLFNEIHIAEGIWRELNAFGITWPGSNEVDNANWIQQHRVRNQALVTALRVELDQGEAESIALAVELSADLVLLDEQTGRQVAERFGLDTIGVIGILLEAKAKGKISAIRPELDDLHQHAGFYMSQQLYQHALHLAGE